jgi:hypothetical protein
VGSGHGTAAAQRRRPVTWHLGCATGYGNWRRRRRGSGCGSPKLGCELRRRAGTSAARSGSGVGRKIAVEGDGEGLRVSGLHESTRGAPAEILLGSGRAEMRRRREIAAADDLTRNGVRAQFHPLERRWSKLAGSGSFLTLGRRCRGGWQRLGCGGVATAAQRTAHGGAEQGSSAGVLGGGRVDVVRTGESRGQIKGERPVIRACASGRDPGGDRGRLLPRGESGSCTGVRVIQAQWGASRRARGCGVTGRWALGSGWSGPRSAGWRAERGFEQGSSGTK